MAKVFFMLIYFFSGFMAFGEIRLPKIITDSMILQRNARVNIWGWASIGEKVSVSFAGKTYRTTTNTDGKWKVTINPVKAGGPYTMIIKGKNELTLREILFGDVWFCSGQSNMVHQMALHKERYEQEIAQANYAAIRHFSIPTLTELRQENDDLPATNWKAANPQDVLQFSAVAYFFAKNIYEKYKVPIGLINASVGGTPIEAWTSEAGLADFPMVVSTIQKNKDTALINQINRLAFISNAQQPKPQDKGITGSIPWYDTTYTPQGWRNINIPGYWEDQGVKDLDGIVWYRRVIDVPSSMTGRPAKVSLGRIVDADFLYINGKPVGNTTYQYPQRRYQLPAGILMPGKNIFVIRVINNAGKGGFVPDKPYQVTAGNQALDLKGSWQYKVGDVFIPRRNGVQGISIQNQPTALFNAMVAPVKNYSIKGILWYQGESNVSNASAYSKLLPALITDWRKQWQQNDLPFLYVQLPNFQDAQYLPAESAWAIMREAQLKALSVNNTGMAVAIDLGEWNDIHPDNKKDVGDRLALAAQKVAYGQSNVVYSGPLYQSFTIDSNRIIIAFTNVGSGLITNDGEQPNHFAIAGADKKFVWAKTKIEGDKIIVWNDNITTPLFVRYAWADNPVGANVYNIEGLPASPFRIVE